jgi:hypothetical protein
MSPNVQADPLATNATLFAVEFQLNRVLDTAAPGEGSGGKNALFAGDYSPASSEEEDNC